MSGSLCQTFMIAVPIAQAKASSEAIALSVPCQRTCHAIAYMHCMNVFVQTA